MSRTRHPATVYLVTWDSAGIFKIGVTNRKRWRDFTLRGARLVALCESEDYADDIEFAAHLTARRIWPRPFRSAIEAEPYLGRGGGGWLECYSGSAAFAELLLPHGYEHGSEHMLKHRFSTCSSIAGQHARALRGQVLEQCVTRICNGRTDGLTETACTG